MKMTERTDRRLQRHTDWDQRARQRGTRTHLTGSITHTCPLFIHCDEAPELKTEWTLLWRQCFKCFCNWTFCVYLCKWGTKRLEIYAQVLLWVCACVCVCMCMWVCAIVCVLVLYICVCLLSASHVIHSFSYDILSPPDLIYPCFLQTGLYTDLSHTHIQMQPHAY